MFNDDVNEEWDMVSTNLSFGMLWNRGQKHDGMFSIHCNFDAANSFVYFQLKLPPLDLGRSMSVCAMFMYVEWCVFVCV